MAKIAIIGGGVIGLSIARALHKLGVRDITVIDRGKMGQEASWAAAGMLAPNAETETIDDFYRLCSDSNSLYGAFASELLDETGIDIEFRPSGTLELAFDEKNASRLERKFGHQQKAGIEVDKLSPAEIRDLEPTISPEVLCGLHYPNDGHVENRKLVAALIKYAQINDIRLMENTAVNDILVSGGNAVGVRISAGSIDADATILATGAWSSLIKIGGSAPPFDVKPIRGQMIALQGTTGAFGKVIYGAGAYLVPRADGRILVGATVEDAGFEKAVTEAAVGQLRAAAIRTMPPLEHLEIVDSWSGFRPFAADEMPIIGPVGGINGLTVATAHYRNGILLAPVTAEIVSRFVAKGEVSPYFDMFSAARFTSSRGAVSE